MDLVWKFLPNLNLIKKKDCIKQCNLLMRFREKVKNIISYILHIPKIMSVSLRMCVEDNNPHHYLCGFPGGFFFYGFFL